MSESLRALTAARRLHKRDLMVFQLPLVLTMRWDQTSYSAHVEISYEIATCENCRSLCPSVQYLVRGLTICDDPTPSKKDQDRHLSLILVDSSGRHRHSQIQSRNELGTRQGQTLEVQFSLEAHLRLCEHGRESLENIQVVCLRHRLPLALRT